MQVDTAVIRWTPVLTACLPKLLGVELTTPFIWAEVERPAGVVLQAEPGTLQIRVGGYVLVAVSVEDVV